MAVGPPLLSARWLSEVSLVSWVLWVLGAAWAWCMPSHTAPPQPPPYPFHSVWCESHALLPTRKEPFGRRA
eukprot:6186379-Pleurochrysis_carterae.AAC.1